MLWGCACLSSTVTNSRHSRSSGNFTRNFISPSFTFPKFMKPELSGSGWYRMPGTRCANILQLSTHYGCLIGSTRQPVWYLLHGHKPSAHVESEPSSIESNDSMINRASLLHNFIRWKETELSKHEIERYYEQQHPVD